MSTFQSTHPSGVRPVALTGPVAAVVFQSTHPSGVRPPLTPRVITSCEISIHAPQWGATGANQKIINVNAFQSTHPSGVRRENGHSIP